MRIHVGCGKRDFGPSWVNVDKSTFPHVTHRDIFNLPCKSEEAEIIYSSHVIEYFDREEVVNLLKSWRKSLKSGGILRIAVPDFDSLARLYTEKNCRLSDILGPLYGKMTSGDDIIFHRTVYDFDSLKELLEDCGFVNIRKYDWRETDHSHHDDHSQAYYPHMEKENGTLISLNVECVKP